MIFSQRDYNLSPASFREFFPRLCIYAVTQGLKKCLEPGRPLSHPTADTDTRCGRGLTYQGACGAAVSQAFSLSKSSLPVTLSP